MFHVSFISFILYPWFSPSLFPMWFISGKYCPGCHCCQQKYSQVGLLYAKLWVPWLIWDFTQWADRGELWGCLYALPAQWVCWSCLAFIFFVAFIVVHMAQIEQQEMKNCRSLNATTCNFVLLTEYLWKMENVFPKPPYIFPAAVYFFTLLLDLVLVQYMIPAHRRLVRSFVFRFTYIDACNPIWVNISAECDGW